MLFVVGRFKGFKRKKNLDINFCAFKRLIYQKFPNSLNKTDVFLI